MTPGLKIIVSGKDITQNVTALCGVIEWSDTVEEAADGFTLTVADPDAIIETPTAGAKIDLSVGYNGNLSRVGIFTVDETEEEGGCDKVDVIVVSGSSAPIIAKGGKSIAARKSFTWENTTLGDIAKKIAAGVGYKASVEPSLAAIAITCEQQTNESDINFLLKLVRRNGGFCKFAEERIVISKEGTGKSTGGKALNVTLTKSDVTTYSAKAGGKRAAYERVKTRVHSYDTGETSEVTVEVPRSGNVGEFGVSQAQTGTYTPVAFDGPNPYANMTDAESGAKSTAKRIARASRTLRLSMPGRLDIVAGGKVTLTGFRKSASGEWVVKSIRNRIDGGGWSMEVNAEGSIKE